MNFFRKALIDISYQFLPELYKKRYFKHSNSLKWENFTLKNEEVELLLLSDFLKHDYIFFDIGANNGSYVNYALKFIEPKQIYAFEPNPQLNKRLNHLFPSINLGQYALSNQQGKATFKIPIIKNQELQSRGTLNIDYKEEDEENFNSFEVEIQTLDTFVKTNKISKINLIKIDVEGHELEVIDGAKETLKALKPVLLIEIEERHHHNKPILEIIQPILNLNYNAFYLDRNTKKLIQINTNLPKQDPNKIKNKAEYINNFIFITK